MADMSPEAVTARLKQASELASLCVKLSRATPDPKQPTPPQATEDPSVIRESDL